MRHAVNEEIAKRDQEGEDKEAREVLVLRHFAKSSKIARKYSPMKAFPQRYKEDVFQVCKCRFVS